MTAPETRLDEARGPSDGRRPRVLYACCHPTLKECDVNTLLDAGFEVVPVLFHVQFRGQFRIDPRGPDNPLSETNRRWKSVCTIPAKDVERIQKIDFYKIGNLPFTYADQGPIRAEKAHYRDSGVISEGEQRLVNQYFDMVVFASFPNVAARALEWFHSYVGFRIYGNENADFSLWDWYLRELYSEDAPNFVRFRDKYVSLPVFDALKTAESPEIMGEGPVTLNSVVMEELEKPVPGVRWAGEASMPVAVTNISYIDTLHSWRLYFEKFDRSFEGIEYAVYGKNNPSDSYVVSRPQIKGQIPGFADYARALCQYRVYCNVGQLRHHSQYTPFECISMGIPTLFLRTSALGSELEKRFPEAFVREEIGQCADFTEMARKAKLCLESIEYAKALSARQRSLVFDCFGRKVALDQATALKERVKRPPGRSEPVSASLFEPSVGREKRILYCVRRQERCEGEVAHWQRMGFEVIPAFDFWSSDQETLPGWREGVALPDATIDALQAIDLLHPDRDRQGALSQAQIGLLNAHVGLIYTSSPLEFLVNMTARGYTGLVLTRYCGVLADDARLVDKEFDLAARICRQLFHNHLWCPSLHALPGQSGRGNVPRDREFFTPCLHRLPASLPREEWKLASSTAVVSTTLPNVAGALIRSYENFIRYFGHFPYRILGENSPADLVRRNIKDPQIVGRLPREEDYCGLLLQSRVYVEPGLTSAHSLHRGLEAIQLGVPTVFWRHSGLGNEAALKFGARVDESVGCCEDWESMAVLVERCLTDAQFAEQLARGQSFLRELVTESEFRQALERIQSALPGLASSSRERSLLPRSARLGLLRLAIRWAYAKRRQRIGRTARLMGKAIKLCLILAGLRPDPHRIRARLQGLIRD